MKAPRLNLNARVANVHDPASRPVVFLGSSNNRLAITLRTSGPGTLGLLAGGPGVEGTMIVVAFAANVPFAAVAKANIAIRKLSPAGDSEMTGAGFPRHLQFDEATHSLSFGVRMRVTLAADEALVLTIEGLAPPVNYSHAAMIVTVAWRNLYQIHSREVELVRLHDGQALTLEPRHQARAPNPLQG
jgi:hypothetical protein